MSGLRPPVIGGPSALLAASAVALTYFLVAGDLPDLGSGDTAVLVAGTAGVGVVAAVVLTLTRAGDDLFPLVLLFVGSAMLVAGMDAAHAGSSATTFEALAAGSFGVLVGRALATPAVALAIPVFVAIVDAWSVASGPTSRLANGSPRGSAELTFDLPSWGDAPGASSRLGLTDAIFLAMFSVWAQRFGLRGRATALGMAAGLLLAVVLSVTLDRAVPALPLMAVGYWLPNLDRFGAMFRGGQAGNVQAMDLEEHTLESAADRCEECGAELTEREKAVVLEAGGPNLCAIHAMEQVSLSEDEDASGEGP